MAERKALQRVESLNYITFSFSFLSQLRSVCFCFDRKCFGEKWLISYFPENMFWKTVLFFVFGCDLQNEHNLFVVENVFIDVYCSVPNRGKYRKRFGKQIPLKWTKTINKSKNTIFFTRVDVTCCNLCIIKMISVRDLGESDVTPNYNRLCQPLWTRLCSLTLLIRKTRL